MSYRSLRPLLVLTVCVAASRTPDAAPQSPPYSGTIYFDPDVITSADHSTFLGAVYTGTGTRTMFDRRVNGWITVQAHLFDATFDDGLSAEIQVNPEFALSGATRQADTYGEAIGRLPTALRRDVQTVWIHRGTEPFGGGNNNLLIHIGQAAVYESSGILEETLVHEASHTSLDADHAASPGWLAAQAADPTFISTYAESNPTREDVAESFLTWLAVRHRADRISPIDENKIRKAIPNRLAYFDAQPLDLYPIVVPSAVPMEGFLSIAGLMAFVGYACLRSRTSR